MKYFIQPTISNTFMKCFVKFQENFIEILTEVVNSEEIKTIFNKF